MSIEFTEVVWYWLDNLQFWYQARWRISDTHSYVVYFPLGDEMDWHPFYEIERRAIAAAAFRQVADENAS